MFDVRRLRVFGEVVRAGSLSAAAATLSYTTSAVSQQITVLEREIGAALLVRGPTGVRPTPAGERLYEHATVILGAIAAAERDVAAVASGNPAAIRVASFASAAAAILPRPVARLRVAFPDVGVELIAADPDDGVELLGRGGVDIAVVTSVPGERPPFPDVVSVPVFDDEFLVVLPENHRLAGVTEVPFRALARERWIVSSATERCPDSRAFRAACAHAGFAPDVSFRAEDYATVQGLVAAGMGVSLVPSLAVASARPDVAVRRVAGRGPVRRVGLAVTAQPQRGSAADAFVGFVKDEGARLTRAFDAASRPSNIA